MGLFVDLFHLIPDHNSSVRVWRWSPNDVLTPEVRSFTPRGVSVLSFSILISIILHFVKENFDKIMTILNSH